MSALRTTTVAGYLLRRPELAGALQQASHQAGRLILIEAVLGHPDIPSRSQRAAA
jgi:hypothetical protein